MPKYISLQERIIANTYLDQSTDYEGTPCWIWIGKRSSRGDYGHINISIGGKVRTLKAHRVSFHAFTGAPLEYDGRVLSHLCNNSLCCAPLHMQLSSQSENMLHCVKCERHNSFRKAKAEMTV